MGNKDFSPDYAIPPGETVLETMEALGMTQVQLSLRTGLSKKHINQIISGEAPITTQSTLLFEKVFGVPASFWSNLERNYRDALARLEEENRLQQDIARLKEFPVKQMIENGWVEKKNDKAEQAEEVLKFYGVTSFDRWKNVFDSYQYAARSSEAYESKPEAVSAWIRRGELLARNIQCRPFNERQFVQNLKEIRSLTVKKPKVFQNKLVDLCADSGVAVVLVKEIPKLVLNGITRWLTPEKALVQLNIRYKWGDIFWFTFFHEAGHVLRHGKKEVFLEFGHNKDEQKEKDADKFAADFLIPPYEWKKFISGRTPFSIARIIAFADSMGISPGIVVGRLQHEKIIPHTHCNGIRNKFEWGE